MSRNISPPPHAKHFVYRMSVLLTMLLLFFQACQKKELDLHKARIDEASIDAVKEQFVAAAGLDVP